MEDMDDDPIPVPKIKAARANTNVNQVAEIEQLCDNDEDMFPAGWEDDAMNRESEDECIAEEGEGEGPSNVSAQHLMKCRSCSIWMLSSPWSSQTVSQRQKRWLRPHWCTTGGKNDRWVRRCRIVAREFKTNPTDESNFPPTSSFAFVRMLLVFALSYGLAITALDVKDALLTVPQVETIYGRIANWIRKWAGNRSTHWLLKPASQDSATQLYGGTNI